MSILENNCLTPVNVYSTVYDVEAEMEKKSDEKGFYDKATTSELMRYAANGIRAWAKGPIAGVASSMADELEMRAAAIEVIERKANCPNCEDGGCNDCLPEPYDSEAR